MKADKKDKFKALLKRSADDKPSANFTASIMQTIEANVQRETALKSILQKEEAVGPSFSFTANVMAGIQAAKPAYVFKPIITTKGWWGIAAALCIVVLLAFVGSAQTPSEDRSGIVGLVSYAYVVPPIYAIAMLVITVLLMGDYLVGRLKTKTGNQLA